MGTIFLKEAILHKIEEFYEVLSYSTYYNLNNEQKDDIKKKDAIVLEFLKYIDDHFKDCSLTEMVDHFKYHPNYISAVFIKATGKSFKDLLQIQRLNKATLYLTNTELPIPAYLFSIKNLMKFTSRHLENIGEIRFVII